MPRFDITCMSVVNLTGRERGRFPYKMTDMLFVSLRVEITEFGLTKDILYQTVIFFTHEVLV